MAYELPLARVYQLLENVSATIASPDLPPCIIGRAYQVMTYVDNKTLISAGNYDKTNNNVFELPNKLAGVILEPSSANLYLDEAYIETSAGSFNAILNDYYITDLSADFTADPIAVGDKIVVSHSSLSTPLSLIVLAITATTLKVNKNFGSSMTGATYSVQKKLADKLMPQGSFSLSGNTVTVLPALNITYFSVDYPVMAAKMYFEYKALRTDLTSSVKEIGTTADIVSQCGNISKENPLAYGLNLCKINTVTTVKYIAVNTIEGDELGWSTVKDILENNTSVYTLALLTDKSSIIGDFKTHCESMATADEHGWRICTGGVPLVVNKDITTGTAGEIYDNSGIKYLRDTTQAFLTEFVNPSDTLIITSPGGVTGSYIIDEVINDHTLKITTTFPVTASSVVYTVNRDLDKGQQAAEVAGTIDSYNSKRVCIMWPDQIEISNEIVDGYYLGCVLAGMVAGLPPHQGFTNLGIGGVDKLHHSNTYFSKSQLNTIAEAGGMIFVQETENSLPYIRHQQTTDTQFVETKELSVVKNFDSLSYYFFGVLQPFIGSWNVTDKTVGIIKGSLTKAAEKKMSEELPKIGSPLKAFSISAEQASYASDKVKAVSKLGIPKPLNGIDYFMSI